LHGIAEEADALETKMKHELFKEGANSSTSTIETVIKIDEDKGSKSGASNQTLAMDKHATHLIDSDDNEYTLTKSSDITSHYEDSRLLNDIILLLLCCLIGSYIMHLVYLPGFFGSILAGVLLGSIGAVKSLIQVETIARGFGIIFIMFCLGLEFNFSKIRKVWAVSMVSSLSLFGVTLVSSLLLGSYLGSDPRQSIMVGACLSLSSTMIAISLLKDRETESSYGRPMLGILVMQDILLGFILALMPTLTSPTLLDAPYTIIRILALLVGFAIISYLIHRYAFHPILGSLLDKNDEIFLAISLGYCLVLMKIASWMDLSLELSCFIAGVLIASETKHSTKTIHLVEPLRCIFSSLFFASIGLFIYPSFLMNKWFTLMSMTVMVVSFKIVSTWIVMRLSRLSFSHALKIAIGLAQVSEFSFILSSRAKNGKILHRETYYALLGVTVLSMLISPLLWYLISYLYPPDTELHPGLKPKMSETLLPVSQKDTISDDGKEQ
jgi:Kef-type K+ transport system membrane component KefB